MTIMDHTKHSARVTKTYRPELGGHRWRLVCSCGFEGPERLNPRAAEQDLDAHITAAMRGRSARS